MMFDGRLSRSTFHLTIYLCILTATLTYSSFIEPSCIKPTRSDLIGCLLNEKCYDRNLPPDIYTGNATDVSVQIIITDLNSEKDMTMELEFTLYLRMKWTDERLNFSENTRCNYSAQKTWPDPVRMGDGIVDKMWIPDLYFLPERKSELHGLFKKNQLVYIYKNGSILFSARFNVKSHCQMKFKKLPYDTQTCPIVIQSYAFTSDQLLLHWNERSPADIDAVDNIKFDKDSLEQSFEFPYDNLVGNFSRLKVDVIFTRNTQSLEIMYIAPVVVLVSVSFTSFLLGKNVIPRFSVPTGSLTQLIVQWSGIYNKLPSATVFADLDRWMLANVIYVGLVLVANALICLFFYGFNDDDKEKEGKSNDSSSDDKEKEGKSNDSSSDDKEKEGKSNDSSSAKKKGKRVQGYRNFMDCKSSTSIDFVGIKERNTESERGTYRTQSENHTPRATSTHLAIG